MKVIRILPLLLTALLVCSCEKMLTVDSTRYLKAEQNTLDSPNDSLYSIAGILAKFQELGDRYVILGDLRADMMDVTYNADQDLCDISDLVYNESNPWLDITPYYRVINHCNYFLTNIDTSIVAGGKKVMMSEYAAAKSIRAWTYLQLALNFGRAYYFTQPILTIDDVNKEYPMLPREDLIQLVYEDLMSVREIGMPNYGQLGGVESSRLFPSVNFLLGELCLWQNKYAEAASLFHEDIYNRTRLVTADYSSTLSTSNNTYDVSDPNTYVIRSLWGDQFYSTVAKAGNSWLIPYFYSSSYGEFNNSDLLDMTQVSYTIAPSQRARDLFDSQVYSDLTFHTTENRQYNVTFNGDLRGRFAAYRECGTEINIESSSVNTDANYDQYEINKAPVGSAYIAIHEKNQVILQRDAVAYLRYAEAVNYLGFPALALAVVNDGLNHNLMLDSVYINMAKIDAYGMSYLKWDDTRFNSNIGTRTRGQGPSSQVVFPPELRTLQDSIDFVETVLVDECALENPFLGTRFHDLMRFSLHGHSTILADNIAKKKPGLYERLLKEENWYIPDFEDGNEGE